MHPIERLRYLSRAGWAEPSELGAEAADALEELIVEDPSALLTACRRMIEHQPGCGPLWWVGARLLSSHDPVTEAQRCRFELENDSTGAVLAEELGDRRPARHPTLADVSAADVTVVIAGALGSCLLGSDRLGIEKDINDRKLRCEVVVAGEMQAKLLQIARDVGKPIWVVAGVGVALPPRLWGALVRRVRSIEPLEGVQMVIHRSGALAPTDLGETWAKVPQPPELASW